ncbi:MAG: PEP-CTERM sorting domain-containing protein [Planctomycetota bacterium]|jgi:hypothetical protein
MKKLLMLMLVFSLASLVNATVIDVSTDGVGDAGNAGTTTDPLEVGEKIYLQIILNHNAYPGWSSYDGYVLDAMDLDLHVSGPADLRVEIGKSGNLLFWYHEDFDVWSQSDPLIEDNGIAQLMGGSLGYILGSAPPYGTGPASPPTKLVWGMYIVGEGPGTVTVDLTLGGTTHYWNYSNTTGGPYGPDYNATEGDLGNLVLIVSIPEPATIALLGVGGLFLLRRRK